MLISLRVTPSEKASIVAAANKEGVSINRFVVEAALEAARKIIQSQKDSGSVPETKLSPN